MDLTNHWVGYSAIALLAIAYLLVFAEEFTHLRKSKPVMLAAGIIWALIGFQYARAGMGTKTEEAILHFLTEFAQLFLFLLAAMTYVNAMSERNIFATLRSWLIRKSLSYRKLFWITGCLSFVLSPLIDNLTTALVMCAVVLAVGKQSPKFIGIGCVNIVVAANAGGAFSPFGDITTLMVWQKGVVEFQSFFSLLIPSAINYVVPAALMSLAVPRLRAQVNEPDVTMKRGAKRIMLLFGLTIMMAVTGHHFLHLPPFLGMMTGLACLKVFGYYLTVTRLPTSLGDKRAGIVGDIHAFDSFGEVARVEWDTLLFFFGVIMCVGGLGFIGYLDYLSVLVYGQLGATTANVLVGLISAVIDNIPIMIAVLEMNPSMDLKQWLLITLTAGAGGSLLSIGSAAGIALMGQAREHYTFMQHLRWSPVIALGYFLSIWVHLSIN